MALATLAVPDDPAAEASTDVSTTEPTER
jgi:hypothetical protein